jgi:hypothetical protein
MGFNDTPMKRKEIVVLFWLSSNYAGVFAYAILKHKRCPRSVLLLLLLMVCVLCCGVVVMWCCGSLYHLL